MNQSPIVTRPYAEDDFGRLVSGWHETNRMTYWYVKEHQRHTFDDAQAYFRNAVLPPCNVWVAERAGELCGLLALEAPWIRQLAVFPGRQRAGVGTALLAVARKTSPRELRLYTFRRNEAARAFYARQGFVAVRFGVSPAPENEPDVELHWVA